MALFALVTIAAVAQALLQPAVASRRAARRVALQHGVESAVERTLVEVIARPPTRWRSLAHGPQPVEQGTLPLAGSGALLVRVGVAIDRLTATVFSIVVDGGVDALDAPVMVRRSVLVELVAPPPQEAAAVTAGGDVALAVDTRIEPDGSCRAQDGVPEAPLLVGDATPVERDGVPVEEGVKRDSAVTADDAFLSPAGISLDALDAAADTRLPPGSAVEPRPIVENDRCIAGPGNWGDVTDLNGPCAGHSTVVVADGDLVIDGGEGRGALIVKGRLDVRGPFRYTGLIVASGGISTTGPVTITGAVYTGPAAPVTFMAGPAVILASRCAMEAAADAASGLRIVPVRGWWR